MNREKMLFLVEEEDEDEELTAVERSHVIRTLMTKHGISKAEAEKYMSLPSKAQRKLYDEWEVAREKIGYPASSSGFVAGIFRDLLKKYSKSLERSLESVQEAAAVEIEFPPVGVAYGEGDFREQYGKYGRLKHRLPVEAWYVGNDGKPKKVVVKQLRGAGADYYETGDDYADFEDGGKGISNMLFPVKGFKKPETYKIRDEYGLVTRWFSFAKGKSPKFVDAPSEG